MSNYLVVAAIEFNVTCARWAFSSKHDFERDPCRSHVKQWHGGQCSSSSAPTCVLIKPDGKTFDTFGYEAETRYSELSEHGDHKRWYYFNRFTKMLFNTVHEEDLFSLLRSNAIGLVPKDIPWVLTIPASWNDSAKPFMSFAAQEAGLSIKNLKIVLTSVATSVYCRYITFKEDRGSGGTTFRPGQKYLVLEAGDAVFLTLHEICSGNKLKEVYKATDISCIGTMVDTSFLDFFAELIGSEAIRHLRDSLQEDYIDFMRDIEIRKREVDLNSNVITLRIPLSLMDHVNDMEGQSMNNIISRSQHAKQVRLNGDKMRLDGSLFRSFFTQSKEKLLKILSAVLRSPEAGGVETILAVGRYSEYPIVQEAIRKEFPRMNVIVPMESDLAAIKGAVIFGHRPVEVTVLKTSDVVYVPDLDVLASDEASSYGDSSTIEDELKEMSDLLKCKRCKQRRVALTFLPCGHCITCEKCGLEVRSCPLCPASGSNVQGTFKTLFTSNSVAFGS